MPEYREQGLVEYFGPDNQDSTQPYGMAASGARALLLWSRQQTEGYNDVNIYNMTSSWRDGLAFCAIIHRYRPDLIEYDKLSKDNIIQNNELAFDICERYLDIPSILDVRDMIEKPAPDKLSVLTFVSQLFNYFKDKIPANQVVSTKMTASMKTKNDIAMSGRGKRQGRAKRFSSALKNVFKSEAKDDRLRVEESLTKQPSNENLKNALENVKKKDSSSRQSLICMGTSCSVCNSKVYILERLVVEHKLFHRACFKCCKCGAGLRPGTYTYDMDSETFHCIYECLGDFKKTQEEIRIKLQPITDKVFDALDKENQTGTGNRSKKSSWSSGTQGNTLGPPFSIVKKNMISIGSLDKSFEDLSNTRRKRSSSVGKHAASKKTLGLPVDSELKKSHNASALDQKDSQHAIEVKHENGQVKSCVKINPMQMKQSSSDDSSDEKNCSSTEDSSKPKSTWKEKAKGPVGLNDAYLREEEEKPQMGSVNKLRMKFMNIDNMIENKHRQNVAKKNERVQRELRRVVPTWNDKDHPNNTSKDDGSGTSKSLESDCDSLETSSGQSSASQMDDKRQTNKSQIIVKVSSVKSDSSSSLRHSSQTKTKKSDPSVQDSHSSPTTRTIPIIVKPTHDSDSDREQSRTRSASSSSARGALSPSSESSFSEVPNSPMSLSSDRWGSQTSLEDNSDNLPKMSIIIAQEASSTKINSRYFTVETCEGKEKNVILEDKELETVDVEGEFKFGDEGHKYTKAQQDILRSLSNCKITRNKSDLVKDEEILLSPLEIMDELNALGTLLTEFEKRGVEMEKVLRNSLRSAEPSLENEDELMREWLTLVQEKNIIMRRESELIYLMKFHQYEDRYLLIECELRALLSMKDESKTVENIKRERELMAELFSLVQRRSSIVDKLEEDKLREKQEEENTKHHLDVDGLHETWGQKQDYTKVAFSRFYC